MLASHMIKDIFLTASVTKNDDDSATMHVIVHPSLFFSDDTLSKWTQHPALMDSALEG